MNETVNNFLLVGDTFMPEMHLEQPGFTYSACGPFIKNKERIEKFMQTGNTDFTYRDELDKACFQHDMAYGKSKDFVKRTQSDKVLKNKAFNHLTNEPNYQSANELHKPVIRKLQERKVSSYFRDNIWGVDLADMQSLSKYNNEIKYLLCAIDLFSKYTWVILIKDKKGD